MADRDRQFVEIYKGTVGKLKKKDPPIAAIGDRHESAELVEP